MQAVIETIFDAVYLVSVITIGILMIRASRGNAQFKLFGMMAVVLGAGDSFHLVPRALALCTTGLENYTVPLGLGKWITSVTMTVFYVLLYYVWRQRYQIKGKSGLTASRSAGPETGMYHALCGSAQKATPSSLSVRGFRPVVSVSKHQESCFSSSATMAERASSVSAMIYSCLKSSTVFRWRSSNKSIWPEPFCRASAAGAAGASAGGCSAWAGANKSSAGRGGFLASGDFFPNSLACMERNSSS